MPKPEKPSTDEQDTFASIVEACDSAESDPDRQLSQQIERGCREAIQAAQNSGQPASVTIKLTVKAGPDRRVSFAPNVKAQLPRPPAPAVTLYADKEGRLHESDPAQMKMAFQPNN